jgi:mannose-6-phosphate isomerase-like protein (cupin superfamily)
MLTRLADAKPFVTKDGSEIRELLHPAAHGPGKMSLAEARVSPGAKTAGHRHPATEEIYHVLSGRGRMLLGGEEFGIEAGDTVRIDPGVRHGLVNDGGEDLVILCCCCPPYAHEDTHLE